MDFAQKDEDLGGTAATLAPAVAPVADPLADPAAEARAKRFADLPPEEEGLPAPPDQDAGFGETFGAAWTAETIRTDAWSYEDKKRRALADQMFDLLPRDAKSRVWDRFADNSIGWTTYEDLVMAEAAAIAPLTPETAKVWSPFPLTKEAFDNRINDERRAELDAAQSVLDMDGGGFAEFLGSSARAMTDQASLLMAPFGGAAGSAWKIIGAEALLGAAGEAAVLPREYDVAQELGEADPNPITRILTGAALGGGLSAGILGIAKAAGMLRARRDGIRAATPPNADAFETELAIDDAEAVLRGDQTVQQAVGPRMAMPPEDGTLPAILDGGTPAFTEVIEAGAGYTVVRAPDGTALRREGTRAWRNNNPGNIEYGPFARRNGAIGTDGRFAVFPTYEAGRAAKSALLFTSKGYRSLTIGQAISRYAPSFENDTRAYTRAITGATGATADTLMADLTPKQRALMLDAMERVEGFKPGRENGVQAAAPRRGISAPTAAEEAASAPYTGPTSRGYTGSGQVSVGEGTRIDVDYEVVDASTLLRASGDFQPRDRSRIASDAWIADTAARLDPAQLMPSPTADRGAPLVGPDNMIESGNGRFGAIERAYERVPDRANAYRAQIEAAGFAIPEGVSRPVLIARRKTELSPEDRVRLTIDAQDSGVAVMTPTEVARASSRAMTPPVLGQFDPAQPITAEANAGFVRAALAGLPRSARNAMFDGTGLLNSAGARQLREAIFARAWPDPDILARYTEGDAGELKSLMEALESSAPAWAALRADIERGSVLPEMDISAHVLDAMRLIAAARDLAAKQGGPIAKAVAELLDEVDLIEGAISPLTAAMVRKFWVNGRAAPADKVADFLTRYANDARSAGRSGGLFDAPGPRDVLVTLDAATFGDLPADFGAARGYATPPTGDPQPLPDQGFDLGASSPEAIEADAALMADLRAATTAPDPDAPTPDAPSPETQLAAPDPEAPQGAGGVGDADAEISTRDELDALAAEFADLSIEMPDGTTLTAREMLDDLDADETADAVLQACAITPTGAAA